MNRSQLIHKVLLETHPNYLYTHMLMMKDDFPFPNLRRYLILYWGCGVATEEEAILAGIAFLQDQIIKTG
jgi:hypothetical protein